MAPSPLAAALLDSAMLTDSFVGTEEVVDRRCSRTVLINADLGLSTAL
jgi:hypothetical protein